MTIHINGAIWLVQPNVSPTFRQRVDPCILDRRCDLRLDIIDIINLDIVIYGDRRLVIGFDFDIVIS